MLQKMQINNRKIGRILGRVAPQEFIGRSQEMATLLSFAKGELDINGFIVLNEPTAGASELLRQTFDEIFHLNNGLIPIYYRVNPNDKTPLAVASNFLTNFLFQTVAYKRRDVSLIDSGISVNDLISFVPPKDLEWIERLIETCENEREKGNNHAYIKLCFSAPVRAKLSGVPSMLIYDGFHYAEKLNNGFSVSDEIIHACLRGSNPFVLSGLRRRMLHLVQKATGSFSNLETMRINRLQDKEAAMLVETLAQKHELRLNDETRDLVVVDMESSPFFISAILDAARDTETSLDSFRNCQRLYVDEVLGGQVERFYTSLINEIAPEADTQHTLIQLLYQGLTEEDDKVPLEIWRKILRVEQNDFQKIMRGLHVNELVSISASQIELPSENSPFGDYMKSRYRMEVINEPRALVVADTLLHSLKRAPKTMAKRYRKSAALGLREIISNFNCQEIPFSLFDNGKFRHYKGAKPTEVSALLESETDKIRLPQVVYTTSCCSYHAPILATCDEEHCAVAHCFENGDYIDANEVVWIAAEIDSKLEVGRGLCEIWCDRLSQLAAKVGFQRVRLWLVSKEGFSLESSRLLTERGIYSSCRQQLELLLKYVKPEGRLQNSTDDNNGHYEIILPMEDGSELIAAETIDNFSRRCGFKIEEINQIKTAIVEACINANEHSYSPDKKINVKFGFADEKLSITITNRGLVPNKLRASRREVHTQENEVTAEGDDSMTKRGWGLTLIHALMDEVVFEQVDDGTKLKMTKLLRKKS